MRISYLADFAEFIPVLAPEIAAHWRHLLPTETAEGRATQLHAHLNKNALPIAWVADRGARALRPGTQINRLKAIKRGYIFCVGGSTV